MIPARCLVVASVLLAGAPACDQYIEIGRVTGREGPQSGPSTVEPLDGAGVNGAMADASSVSDVPVIPDAGTSDATSTILWSSNTESGDLTDWTGNGAAAGGSFVHQADLSASQDVAHSGTYSIRIGFDTADNQAHGGVVYHRMESTPAYYAAWFFIPVGQQRTWWTLFDFFSEREPGNWTSRQELWNVNINRTTLYFYDERSMAPIDAILRKPFPTGQWVHVETYCAYEPAHGGHIKVWQDGDLILDVSNLADFPNLPLYWGIGSEDNGTSPSASTLYADDATISTVRVGP